MKEDVFKLVDWQFSGVHQLTEKVYIDCLGIIAKKIEALYQKKIDQAIRATTDAVESTCEALHQKEIRGIFEEIDKLSLLLLRFDSDGQSYTEIQLSHTSEWQVMKSKYIKEE